MLKSQRIIAAASLVLPLVALVAFLATPVSLHAGVGGLKEGCLYADEYYSVGACLPTACDDPNQSQQCTGYTGNYWWSPCRFCDQN